jgi:phosphodiesterase/alkaline phosphatase D-like protein
MMKRKPVFYNFFHTFLAILLVFAGFQTLGAAEPTAARPGIVGINAAPAAVTGPATATSGTTGTLSGTVTANGETTTVTFEIGTTTAYGSMYAATPGTVTGSTPTSVSADVFELQPNTLYHYRVVASNASGTSYGADMTFTSGPPAPQVLTSAATGVGGGNATLNGTVSTKGEVTDVSFEYGTDTNYGTTVPADFTPIDLPGPVVMASTATISGLADNTVYHFRIVASSPGGVAYGNDMSFATGTAGTAPAALTAPATAIGTESATLNGTVNAADFETTVIFEYGLDATYGSTAIANPGTVTGSTNTAVNAPVLELSPATTYHFRVVATNAYGTTNGADMTFTTLPQAPVAVTSPATPVGDTTATLNGLVTANGDSTTVTFEYGIDTSYGTTVSADQNPVFGNTPTVSSRAISGLVNGVTYHYRVVATNSGGTTYGADMTFTTGIAAPTAVTNAATAIGTTSALLNGSVNANDSETIVSFEWGLTAAYGRETSAIPALVTGTANTAVTLPLASLAPNSTYHYRVKAMNASGIVYGADMTFSTLAAPTVVTGPATAVTTADATLNGTANANGLSSTITFEYGTDTSYGTTVTADQSPVAGTTVTAVSKAITGLTADTVYHYRIVGQNTNGTTYGDDMMFKTTVGAPVAVTVAAAPVLADGATLNGLVDANNAETTVTFEYGLDVSYGTSVPADQSPLVASATGVEVSAVLTGLTDNTTYFYRVVAQNSNGTTYGADMTFTTSSAPIASTEAATGIGATFATLNALVNSNGGATSIFFQYGTTASYGFFGTAIPSTITGTTEEAIYSTISGLTPNTTYHYRVIAQKPPAAIYGQDMTFTTSSPPTATVDPATSIGTTTATLNGSVNAGGADTVVTFEYGETIAYGRTATANQSPVSGASDTAVSVDASFLMPNTTYHYRVVAQNVNGTAYSGDMTFTTTGGVLPVAVTDAASAVTGTGATLNGTVTPNGSGVAVWFEYGVDVSYGSTATATQSPTTGLNPTAVSVPLTGLTGNTTYHYRVVAQNSTGTVYGADMTFFTAAGAIPTVTTNAATNIGTSVATLNGTVNANGDSTTVTFQYGFDISYGRVATATPSPVTGSTDTAVNASIIDLAPNTVYHYRAVGQNSFGTVYGADMTFTTAELHTLTVSTSPVTDITSNSAIAGGVVIDDGGAPVTARGVCWSTAPNPTTAGSSTSDGTGEGPFISSIVGLSPGTTYYVKAYAVNYLGTVYGNQVQFTTAGSPSDLSVNITNPKNNATVSGIVPITATARSSESEVLSVEFYVDKTYIGKDTTSPYQMNWDTSSYSAGKYTIRVVARDALGNKAQKTVKVTIAGGETDPSEIWVNRKKFNFGAVGHHASHPQKLIIRNKGVGPLNWTTTSGAGWLSCTPASGAGSAIVDVTVDPSGMAVGNYTSTLTISDPNAVNSPVAITVKMKVHSTDSTQAPFGSFTTPLEGVTISGSVPVTGWVLDDIGVETVKIYRESSDGGNMVYIGDAVLVDGARPDTEEAYPDYPGNYKAGWGYMLLTNFLPNQGNGTFTLHAEATDMEGTTVTLGTKTITCDNANAVKPFGAIDTPAMGGIASGKEFINFGWVLTPQPNQIPYDGSTIKVWIDGKYLGHPVYNQYRGDINDMFPGYYNANGAGGYFLLDTTAYETGVHTIAWTATDTAGNTDGIGSRYFTIDNSISGSNSVDAAHPESLSAPSIQKFPPSPSRNARLWIPPIDSDANPPVPRYFDLEGTIKVKELETVLVDLQITSSDITGYLMSNGVARSLPTGATVAPSTGIFSWSPGPGFVGWYSFKFIIEGYGDYDYQKTVEVFIEPKFKTEIYR